MKAAKLQISLEREKYEKALEEDREKFKNDRQEKRSRHAKKEEEKQNKLAETKKMLGLLSATEQSEPLGRIRKRRF